MRTANRNQVRKGGKIPYLGHLLAVSSLVIDDAGSEDEAIGALLHDALADQGATFEGGRQGLREYIHTQFGSVVGGIVDACTDDEGFEKHSARTPAEERDLWLERKRKYASRIAHKSSGALRVMTADKVHNVESILDTHAAIGPAVWQRFRTKSRDDQLAVYSELAVAIIARSDQLPAGEKSRLPARLQRAVYAPSRTILTSRVPSLPIWLALGSFGSEARPKQPPLWNIRPRLFLRHGANIVSGFSQRLQRGTRKILIPEKLHAGVSENTCSSPSRSPAYARQARMSSSLTCG